MSMTKRDAYAILGVGGLSLLGGYGFRQALVNAMLARFVFQSIGFPQDNTDLTPEAMDAARAFGAWVQTQKGALTNGQT